MSEGSEQGRAAQQLDRAALFFCLAPRERELLGLLLDNLLGATLGHGATRVRDVIERSGASVEEMAAALDPAGALTKWNLITVGDGAWRERSVALDETFWPRLVGHWPHELPRALPLDEDLLDRLIVDDSVRARVSDVARWASQLQRWPTIIVHGPAGSGRATLATAIAGRMGMPALVVRGAGVRGAAPKILAREVIWQEAVLVVDDADDADNAALDELERAVLAPVILTSSGVAARTASLRPIAQVRVTEMGHAARSALWRRALQREGLGEAQVDVDRVAARFRFGPERIAAAVRSVASTSELDSDALVQHCRGLPAGELGGLARRMKLPFSWQDIVLSGRVRRELELMVAWGRHAPALFDDASARAHAPAGVGCLFHGPPGTGKTMAAQVIARQLDRDLYRVDLSQVIDKYIGETEKRLDRVLRDAERADCVLLFDEADALFARRTEVREARDRYANIETSFLLQRLEEHRGVCILASNLQSSIDPAFHRRLLVIAEFPLPSAAERKTIWERQLPASESRDDDTDSDFLAARFALSGGDIRNAVVVAALFAAQDDVPMAMRHLVVAGWREQARSGRLVDARELGPWRDAVTAFASGGSWR